MMFVNANALQIPLADESVQCVITSPPYYNQRDYNAAYQIGLEATPILYVGSIVEVFRGIRRVLKPDGVVWLNLGDKSVNNSKWGGQSGGKNTVTVAGGYHTARHNRINTDLPEKSIMGLPWRVAFALQDDGWILRQDIVWHKPNALPESVKDRPTRDHEYIFLLTKNPHYYYDHEAIKEDAVSGDPDRPRGSKAASQSSTGDNSGLRDKQSHMGGRRYKGFNERYFSKPPVQKRNKRSVWSVSTAGFTGAHFAVFPPALVEPMVLAGSRPGDVVLDPFCGSGTTGLVARKHERRFVGIDLNYHYLRDVATPRQIKAYGARAHEVQALDEPAQLAMF